MCQCRSVDVVVLMMGSVVVFVCVVNDDLLYVMVFSDQSRGSRTEVAANYGRSICYRWTAQVELG